MPRKIKNFTHNEREEIENEFINYADMRHTLNWLITTNKVKDADRIRMEELLQVLDLNIRAINDPDFDSTMTHLNQIESILR
jgi:hypothetical protein